MREFQLCSKCDKYPIANKKYQLCLFCNRNRLDHDKPQKVVKRSKKDSIVDKVEKMALSLTQDKLFNDNVCTEFGCVNHKHGKAKVCIYHYQKERKARHFKRKKEKLKETKNKEKEVKQELAKIRQEKKQEKLAIGNKCDGCNKAKNNLDYSHILSVGTTKQFETDPENHNLLCRECHQKWESWDPLKMFSLLCIEYNLNYMRIHAKDKFWRLYFKVIDQSMLKQAKVMDEIDNKITKQENEGNI